MIAFLSALSVVYGALAAPEPYRSLLPAVYAFLIISGREVLKGIEDLEGDRIAGVKTLAVAKGPGMALKIAALFLLSVVAISPLPLFNSFNIFCFFSILLGVNVPILMSLFYIHKDPMTRAWKTTRILKIPLFISLLVFLFGG